MAPLESATTLPESSIPTDAPTATWTETPSQTPTTAPTETPLPTTTDEPTATPTVAPEAITAENIDRLVELARFGSPAIRDMVISGDGRIQYVSTSAGLLAFAADTQDELTQFDIVLAQFSPLAPSHDGGRVLVQTDADLRVYNLDGSLARVLWTTPTDTPTEFWTNVSGALSPDGSLTVAAYSHSQDYVYTDHFDVIQVDTGEVIFSERGVNPVFSPDGSRLAVEWDSKVMIYDTSIWEKVTHLSLWMMAYSSKWAFSPDGSRMAIASPERVEIWDIARRKAIRSINGYAHNEWGEVPQGVQWSPDSALIGIVDACQVSTWEVATGERLGSQDLEPCWAAFTLDNQGGMEFTQVPDLGMVIPTYQQRQLVFTGSDTVGLAVDAWFDWYKYAANYLYQFSSNGEVEQRSDPTGNLRYVLDDNGQVYHAVLGDGEIMLQTHSGDTLLNIELQNDQFFRPLYLDGNKFIYTVGNTIGQADFASGRIREYGLSSVFSWAVAPTRLATLTSIGGRYTITGIKLTVFDEQMRVLYQNESGDRQYNFASHQTLAFSPDGNLLAFAETGFNEVTYLRLLDIPARKLMAEIDLGVLGHNPVTVLRYIPDGSRILVGLTDGRILLVDPEAGSVTQTWQAHTDAVLNLAFSPDGSMLASSSRDGFVKLWGVQP